MVHYLAFDLGPRHRLGRFVEQHVPGAAWAEPWNGRVDMSGVSCVHAALTLVQEAAGLSQVLRYAVALGGDTDTVAAMAMFAASLCRDVAADLPQGLYDGLEDGPYGARYLRDLDVRLTGLMRT
jgi:hypothetical protein